MIIWTGRPLLSMGGLGRGRKVCSGDTEMILPFLLVSEPTGSDKKDGFSAADGAAAR